MGAAVEAMRLVDADTSEELVLWPAAGNGDRAWVVDFNPGFPESRAVTVNNPGWNGATDYTTLHGSKAVALVLQVIPQDGFPTQVTLSELRAWCRPGRRIGLYYTPAGMSERLLYLRGDQLGGELAMHALLTGAVEVQMQWACPDGVEYSSAVTETTIMLQDATTGGREYPLVYPRTYTAQIGTGTGIVTNAGTVDSAPIIRMYGPVSSPKIANDTDGGRFLQFTGYTLGSTDYLEINMGAKTVQWRGEAGANANRRANVSTPGWWVLKPGPNTIRFTATSGSSPSQLLVLSQDAWI